MQRQGLVDSFVRILVQLGLQRRVKETTLQDLIDGALQEHDNVNNAEKSEEQGSDSHDDSH